MKKVLLLGAGLVSRPLARYLLEKGFSLTVADQERSKAAAIIEGHPGGLAEAWTTEDKPGLAKLVAGADLAVSLLPAVYHPLVAEQCIALGKPMVTASYVSPAMRALDTRARQAGVLILNEIGVDPGIDHMSAMKVIDRVKSAGGNVLSFKSYCGGLPAPEANNNPWGYKFSWSPRGALLAGRNSARYLQDGRQIDIPGPELFGHSHILDVPGLGELEAYPNRDSMNYIDLYGLQGAATVFRGTLRYKNWCAAMLKISNSGLLDEKERDLKGMTFRQFSASLLPGAPVGPVKEAFAAMLCSAPASREMQWLDWLGLFGEEQLPLEKGAPVDVMAARMVSKMSYAAGERDMLVMHHEFIAGYREDGRKEKITSTLIDFGIPGGDTSMARTVSLPVAMAARLILEGKIKGTGIQIPVTPGIYEPLLKELEEMENGIHFRETASALNAALK